jgi:hypothetical protein
MRRLVLLCVLVLAATAGCGTALEAPQGHARAGSRPSVSAAPSVTLSAAPAFDRPSLVAQAKRALMAQDALVRLGGPSRAEDTLDAAGIDGSFAICDKRAYRNGASSAACSAFLARDHLLAT